MGIYDLTVKDLNGEPVSLAAYRGKVLLIVNTATQCGFTPQYEGLQQLYDKYRESGFEILDFPCNQFASQAPGTEEEIHAFCTLKYHTTFPQFAKIDVNGAQADPLYQYLKGEKGGMLGKAIKWNFTKFLVDRSGRVVERYGSAAKPENIAGAVEKLLAQTANV
ncbi:MAG: glutathione peroxidase [Sporolactobacillus sp.]